MNVLYLHTHDMGRYNQLYGFAARTPAFQSVADDGILFRNAHSAAPTCSPSRAALLTGRWPHSNGMTGLAHRGFKLNDPTQHLSVWLRSHGYETALFGEQHEAADPAILGYNTILERDISRQLAGDREAAEQAAEFILNYKGEKPLFMSMGIFAPHGPYIQPLGDINPNCVQPPIGVPDLDETRLKYAKYLAYVEYADSCAETVLRALKERGIYDDTLILLTTDHGVSFPKMKCWLYDAGTAVTLALKIPGAAGNKINDALVSQIDVFPTLCEIVGIPKPEWLQGKSMLPLIHGEKEQINEAIFSESTYHSTYNPMRAVRTQRYKYIRRFHNDLSQKPRPADKVDILAYGEELYNSYEPLPREEMYDILLDPVERNNLAANENCKETLEALRKQLFDWMSETEDPLLKGDYPAPAGARLDAM